MVWSGGLWFSGGVWCPCGCVCAPQSSPLSFGEHLLDVVLQSLAEALVNVLLYEWLHLFVFNHLRHTQCLYALDRVAAFAFPLEWYLCRALAS